MNKSFWKPSSKERIIGALFYIVIIFSLVWVSGIVLDLIVFYFIKNKYLKFHALQASVVGIILIVFMSLFGFVVAVFFPSQDIQAVTMSVGVFLNLVFVLFAASVLIKKEIRIKTLVNYVFS